VVGWRNDKVRPTDVYFVKAIMDNDIAPVLCTVWLAFVIIFVFVNSLKK